MGYWEVGVDGGAFSSMRRRFEGGLLGVKMFIIEILRHGDRNECLKLGREG